MAPSYALLILHAWPDAVVLSVMCWLYAPVKSAVGLGICVKFNSQFRMQEAKPSYRQLEAILKGIQGSGSSQTWAQRLRSEFAFNKESLNRKK